MKHLRVRLEFARAVRHPMHDFLVDDPRMDREELWSWSFVGETPIVLFRVFGARAPYHERIVDVESVETFQLTAADGDGSFYALVRAAPTEGEWEWMLAFAQAALLVVPPVVYTGDGDAVFEVVGDAEDLRRLLEGLPDSVDTTVERVGDYGRRLDRDAPLTNRQREVVATAVDLGYYDVPREATLDDVATELGVASSTVSDHLRKAEAAVMGSLTDESTPGA